MCRPPDVVPGEGYTVLVPNGLTPEQIAFWTRALEKVLVDDEFALDLAHIVQLGQDDA